MAVPGQAYQVDFWRDLTAALDRARSMDSSLLGVMTFSPRERFQATRSSESQAGGNIMRRAPDLRVSTLGDVTLRARPAT